MEERQLYALSADILLYGHALFVAFVVLGLVSIVIGKPLGWSWVRNRRFRWAHLMAIGFVVFQSWLGHVCPLTVWEMELRERAGEAVYVGSFVSHWVAKLLYYRVPDWLFSIVYTGFGALVLIAWVWVPPLPLRTGRGGRQGRHDPS